MSQIALHRRKRTCAFCEYFDGGGARRVAAARSGADVVAGDCLNHLSPRFETNSGLTCDAFVPDSSEGREE